MELETTLYAVSSGLDGRGVVKSVRVSKQPCGANEFTYTLIEYEPFFGQPGHTYFESASISTDKSKIVGLAIARTKRTINERLEQLDVLVKHAKTLEAQL